MSELEIKMKLSSKDRLKLLVRALAYSGMIPKKILIWDIVSIFDKELDKRTSDEIERAVALTRACLE